MRVFKSARRNHHRGGDLTAGCTFIAASPPKAGCDATLVFSSKRRDGVDGRVTVEVWGDEMVRAIRSLPASHLADTLGPERAVEFLADLAKVLGWRDS